jgi:hypothetical protein
VGRIVPNVDFHRFTPFAAELAYFGWFWVIFLLIFTVIKENISRRLKKQVF